MRRFVFFFFILVLIALTAACRRDNRPALLFLPTELPEAQVGEAFQVTIAVSQNQTPVDNIYMSGGSLPAGLEFTNAGNDTAEIHGLPQESGTFEFTIEAWCLGTNISGQTGAKNYTLIVN